MRIVATVDALLSGKQIDMPPLRQAGATFKTSAKAGAKGAQQDTLPL